jgi:superfamily II DNA or RNA helicase
MPMSLIRVFSSFIVIDDYEGESKLEKFLSLWDPDSYSYIFSAFRFITRENSTSMVVPRTIGINLLRDYFPDKKIKYMQPVETPDVDIRCLLPPKNKLQEEAIEWIAEKRQKFSHAFLHLKTDSGKTYIAINDFCETKKKTLIVVHLKEVAEQWKERIQQFTNIKEDEIGLISGVKSLDKFKHNGKEKVFIAIHKTLGKVIEENPKRLYDFCQEIGIENKIIDEAHLEILSTILIDLYTDIPFTLYLTATGKRTKWTENSLFQRVFPIKFAFGKGSKGINENEKTHKIKMVEYTTNVYPKIAASFSGRHGFDLNKWSDYTMGHMSFYADMIDHYIKEIKKANPDRNDIQVCILFHKLNQCSSISEHLAAKGYDCGLYNSGIKPSERKDQLKKEIIISTEKSMGAAIDSNIDSFFVFVPFSSDVLAYQIIGRLRDRGLGLYYDFYDSSIEGHVKMSEIRTRHFKKTVKSFVNEKFDKTRETRKIKKKLR